MTSGPIFDDDPRTSRSTPHSGAGTEPGMTGPAHEAGQERTEDRP
jgi:hypothetical protein